MDGEHLRVGGRRCGRRSANERSGHRCEIRHARPSHVRLEKGTGQWTHLGGTGDQVLHMGSYPKSVKGVQDLWIHGVAAWRSSRRSVATVGNGIPSPRITETWPPLLSSEGRFLLCSGAQSERDAEPFASGQQSVPEVDGWHHMQTPRLCFPRCRASLPIRSQPPGRTGFIDQTSLRSGNSWRFLLHEHGQSRTGLSAFLGTATLPPTE